MKDKHYVDFVLIYKSVFNHTKFAPQKPFSRFEAWIWMLLNACRKKEGHDVYRDFGGKDRLIHEGYGQLTHSTRFLAEAWGWSQKKVRLALLSLSSSTDPEMTIKTTQQITQITICNFYDYQNPLKAKGHSKDSAETQQGLSKDSNYNSITLEQVNKKKRSVSKKPKRKSSWTNSPVSMNCDQFVTRMLKSPQRHVQIIGHLADEMKPGLKTMGQWQVFFDRYKKEASVLVPFTDDQLAYGARKAITNHPDIWTLETIKKEILKQKIST